MKLLIFKKFKNLSDADKLLYLKQSATWTDINGLMNAITILLIVLYLIGVI